MFRNLKLGPKFFISLLGISIVPLAILSIFNYVYSKSQLEKKTIDSLQAINDSRAAHINYLVRLRQEQAKELAGTFMIRQLKEDGYNPPEVTSSIQEHIESIFQELKTPPKSDYKYIDQESTIENISVWDIYGNIIANTNRKLIGHKMPFDFLHILYEKGAYFQGFEKDPLTGEIFLTILEGVRNWDSREYSGVVFLKSSAQVLNEITAARKGLGRTAETYIVDNNRFMITESRFVKDTVLKRRVNTVGADACFSGQPGPRIYTDHLGRTVLGVHQYLSDQQWCILTEMDVSEAFASIITYRRLTYGLVAALILLVIFLVRIVGDTFVRPIMRLRDASLQIARGKYDVDITAAGQDELGELARSFHQMAKILDSTTRELRDKNTELEEQKILLEKANKELDSFVYTASHDLRAPLRGISSFANFLEEDYKSKLDAQGQDYLQEIQKGAKRLTQFIDDLLTLSRISRIKNPYERVDIRALLDSILERIKFDIQDKHVDLKIQEPLPVIVCDRIKIGEVLLNLINNAIKFSSKNNPSGPRVEVGGREEADNYRFFVKDNGIGIDPKYHDQIFGIFKRLHTVEEYEGSGAGLSIVKKVIDDHGGKIWIESQPGQGATFYFTVPKGLVPAAAGSTPEEEKA